MTSQQAPEETKRPRLPGAGPLFLSAPSGTAGRLSRRGRWIPGSILECHVRSILVNAGNGCDAPRYCGRREQSCGRHDHCDRRSTSNDAPQRYCFRNNSGSLAKLTANRRASSLVSRLAAVRRPGSCS